MLVARRGPRLPPWVMVLVSGLIAALLFTPVALWLDYAFAIPDDVRDQSAGLGTRVVSEFFGLAPILIFVWAALNAVRFLRLHPPSAARDLEPVPDFWARMPAELGRDLVAVSAELHYLRIYTDKGDALVLGHFTRSVDQLDSAVRGVQIHRSHWVALSHVTGFERRNQGGVCQLDTGLILPVSRARKPDLQDALARTKAKA